VSEREKKVGDKGNNKMCFFLPLLVLKGVRENKKIRKIVSDGKMRKFDKVFLFIDLNGKSSNRL
jgi:hypothetical protein